MNIKEDYNAWSASYDTDRNRTRDLEQVALAGALDGLLFQKGLEAGCGTGKNTLTLLRHCSEVVSLDFSQGMLDVARSKIKDPKVTFRQADLTEPWPFPEKHFDLIVFSLVLEHIPDLRHIFSEAARVLAPDGLVYIGELHPFRQYLGSKARFETGNGTQFVTCYTHHISEFCESARTAGFSVARISEHFDAEPEGPPRVIALQFRPGSQASG